MLMNIIRSDNRLDFFVIESPHTYLYYSVRDLYPLGCFLSRLPVYLGSYCPGWIL